MHTYNIGNLSPHILQDELTRQLANLKTPQNITMYITAASNEVESEKTDTTTDGGLICTLSIATTFFDIVSTDYIDIYHTINNGKSLML